jgi:hypothetical protein
VSIEYRDGNFSEALPLEEALRRFSEEALCGVGVRALHVGSVEELDAIKSRATLSERLTALEEKIKDIEPLRPGLVLIPTTEESQRFRRLPDIPQEQEEEDE